MHFTNDGDMISCPDQANIQQQIEQNNYNNKQQQFIKNGLTKSGQKQQENRGITPRQDQYEYNNGNQGHNYFNEQQINAKDQVLNKNQLKHIHEQMNQIQNKQQTSQSPQPKFIQRSQSTQKINRSQTINQQIQHSPSLLNCNPNSKSSLTNNLNPFSTRSNNQQNYIQEQRQSNSCITPEKITQKILDMSLSESKNDYLYQQNQNNNQSNQQNTFPKQKSNLGEINQQNLTPNKNQSCKQQTMNTIEQKREQINIEELEKCIEHNEVYSLFCETDKKLCCVNCVYKGNKNHKNHNVIPLKQSFNLLKTELNTFKTAQKDKLHQIDEAIRIQSNNRQSMLKNFFSYKEIVNKEFQRIIGLIQQRQAVVLEEVNSVFSSKLHEAEENLRQLSDIRSEFKGFKEFDNQSKNNTFQQQVQVYAFKQHLSKSLKVFDGISIIENTSDEINSFDFQSKHNLISEINQLGRIKNSLHSKNINQKQLNQKPQQLNNQNKQQASPINIIKSSLSIINDQKNVKEYIINEEIQKRNQEIKQGLNSAGVRQSLEIPSGHNSLTSRQRCSSNQQRSVSPQPLSNNNNNNNIVIRNQLKIPNNYNNTSLPIQQSRQVPSQMEQMNVFEDLYPAMQKTIQTERQLSSTTSKKSINFNDKPPLNNLKRQPILSNNQENDVPKILQFKDDEGNESEENKKQKKIYNSSSNQGLFISNEGQLNYPVYNQSNISDQSQQVLFQTQSGSYSTKRTQYSSTSQNGIAKFSSLSAQIKQLTQNVSDNFECDEQIPPPDENKENAFQEPEEQMTYLNQFNSKNFQYSSKQQKQVNKNNNILSQKKEQQSQQIQQQQIVHKQPPNPFNSTKQQNDDMNSLSQNQQKQQDLKQLTKSASQYQKPANIFSQTTQNLTQPLSNQTSFFLNTSCNQQQENKTYSQIHSNNNSKNLNQSSSGIISTRRSINNKFITNESLENSIEGNEELIRQINEDIKYENFTLNQSQQDENRILLSSKLIESRNLNENNNFDHSKQPYLQNKLEQNQTIFSESNILDSQNAEKLINCLPFELKQTNLIYNSTQDKLSSDQFHQKCDGKGPYLVITKANSFIFGYYSPISFLKSDKYITCADTFIFSLKNIYNTPPLIFPIKQDKKFIALYQSIKNPCLGSTLQNKQDLWINFDDPRNSYSCLGYAYKLEGNYEGSKILAGQYTDWNVQGIEVFSIVT